MSKGGGGGGGDGGATDRQAKEDARIADAVKRINETFGISGATENPIDRAKFTHASPVHSSANLGTGFFGNTGKNNQQSSGLGMNQQPRDIGFFGNSNNNGSFNKNSSFDQAGYDSAVAAENSRVSKLPGAGRARENLYSTISRDTTNNLITDLNKERSNTDRELNFNLARSGLTGGSRDIDSHRDVLDTFNQGALKASNLGMQNANNARRADDNTRTDLISRIRAGLDQDSAIQQSTESMRNNAAIARDNTNNQSLTGFFTNIRNELDRSQYNQGYNQGIGTGAINPMANQGINKPQAKAFNGSTSRYGIG